MLSPRHLAAPAVPNLEAEREAQSEASKPEAKPKPKIDPRKLKKVYTFDLVYVDGHSVRHEGVFESHILSMQDRSQVGVIEARLGGGQPWEALPPATRADNAMLAHLIVALKVRPAWAQDLQAILDPGLIWALYAEVASHEATFLGRRDSEKSGKE